MALLIETVLRATGLRTVKVVADEALYSARVIAFSTPFGEEKRAVLYLQSAAGMPQLRDIRANVQLLHKEHPISEILVPRSSKLAGDRAGIQRELRLPQVPVRTLHELLETSLRKVASDTDDQIPSVFLDPSIHISAGELPAADPGHKALVALEEWAGSAASPSRLGVLLAAGGVGKTTVSAALCKSLRAKGKTPVLVTADRWARLSNIVDISLWDIWNAALQHEGLSVPDMDTFDTYVKAGILFPILDGFDELCSQRSDKFEPGDLIEALLGLLAEEEGRILITTRDAYWNEYVPEETRSGLWVSQLLPFNKQQVMKYFEKSFLPQARPDYDRAVEIVSTLQKAIPVDDGPGWRKSPLGVPAVVNLIREAARAEPSQSTAIKFSRADRPVDAVEEIITFVCERERVRRLIHAPSDRQKVLFTELATDLEEPFTREDILTWRSVHLPELDSYPAEADAVPSHFLLSFDGAKRYRFRFALAAEFFAARWLADLIVAKSQPSAESVAKAGRLLDRHSSTADTFLEKVAEFLIREPVLQVERGFPILFSAITQRDRVAGVSAKAQSALVHLALSFATSRSPSGPKLERTEALLRLLGVTNAEIRDLRVEGLLSGLDLSAVSLVRCAFKNAGFIRCRFAPNRAFEECIFEGSLLFQGCEGLRRDSFVGCRFSSEATAAIQQAVGAQGVFAVSEVQLRDGLREAFRQMGAPSRFHPIDELTRRRGKLAASVIGEAVWDALLESGTVQATDIGRGKDRGLFSIDREAAGAVVQFMNSGLAIESVGRALDSLRAKYLR